MIEFHLPNFRCLVSEIKLDNNGNAMISGKKSTGYCYAESQAKAEEQLKKYMSIHVYKVEPCNFMEDWKGKVDSIRKEVVEAIADNKKPPYPRVWGDLKEHLITLFYGKCGYCEAQFISVSFGDVEHYRPKGRVNEDKKHKGYYWLAYEPTNYLPACTICNEAAKRDHFPIAGTRAYSEKDPLDDEEPLLINPYHDAFEDHLEFLPSTHPTLPQEPGKPQVRPGGVKGKTPKGLNSISKLELYRASICDQRQREMLYARLDIKQASIKLVQAGGDKPAWDEFARSLQNFLSEDRPFRTAVYYELREFLNKMNWEEETVKNSFAELGFHA
jgi:hypothetical protein